MVTNQQRRGMIAGVVAGAVIVGGGAAVFAAATGDDASSGDGSGEGGGQVSATCAYTANGDPLIDGVGVPDRNVTLAAGYTATMETNRGDIVFDLDAAAAPCTVNAFVEVARSGALDGTACGKVTGVRSGGRFLECGDPTGTNSGTAGFDLPLENGGVDPYRAGQLVAVPASTGSQTRFRIMYADSVLGGTYSVFGTVTSGQEIVDEVGEAGAAAVGNQSPVEGPPALRTVIESITVTEA